MTKCDLCQQGEPATTVRCDKCQDRFHLHQRQFALVLSGSIILADCPSCGAVNCFLKRSRRRIVRSGPMVYDGQTFLNLRGRRGKHGIST